MTSTMVPATHNTRKSRSNSTSSSLLTVKHANPKSSNRTSYLRNRPASPEEMLMNYDLLAPGDRTDASIEKPSASNLNINRWSHSTSSSTSAIDTEAVKKRMQNPSRRMSVGPGFSGNGNKTAPTSQTLRNKSQQRSPSKSPMRSSQSDPTLLAGNEHANRQEHSPNLTKSLTPTSMYNTTSGEYFGETWHHRKLGEPVTAMSIHYLTTAGQNPQKIDDSVQKSPLVANLGATPFQSERAMQVNDVSQMENSASSQSAEQRRSRGHRSPTQKTMLSKALAKANTAVLLDNASNIESAIEAYAEACDLLQQVMIRSSDADDRKKLSAIRSTYSNRIAELHDMDDSFAGLMDKALPDDPPIDDTNAAFFISQPMSEPNTTEVLEQVHIPPRQESLLPQIFGGESYIEDTSAQAHRKKTKPPNLALPMETKYMPPPLSPRPQPSPISAANTTPVALQPTPETPLTAQHVRDASTESTSWLDTVDDADSSTSSSRLSSLDFGHSDSQNLVDEIEAEFDAAMNAAVDAAYEDDAIAEETPRPGGKNSKLSKGQSHHRDFLDEDTTEEEERLLDEMTQGYVFDDFHFDNKSKSALPRQSDSSSFSNRTWGSSVPSTTLSNGTNLSTLAETLEASSVPKMNLPGFKDASLPQAPTMQPPRIPESVIEQSSSNPRPQSFDRLSGPGLRDRRLSGQSARQLKIETFARRGSTTSQRTAKNGSLPTIEIPPLEEQPLPHTAPIPPSNGLPYSTTQAAQPITPMASVHSNDSMTSDSPATPGLTQGGSQGSAEEALLPSSPSRLGKMMPPAPIIMRKNLSSSSLRMRNLSVATTDESPITPGSAGFPPDMRKAIPPLPTPSDSKFNVQSFQAGGMYLFDDHIGTPTSPKTPRTPGASSGLGAPVPLEPCPESFLLRPFWLMRCLFQTISHPRGGYISTKLFIPRDIWRVKNVKLKLLDDKVSQCDLLTAALLKLSRVDNLDADAVLDELTIFEIVLDQVRISLQKKLGSEVGLSSSANVFKSPTDEASDPLSAKPSNSAAKSFASGWRKLRSKSSTATMSNTHSGQVMKDPSAPHTNAGLTISSLPMTTSTSVPTSRSYNNRSRPAPPTPTQLTNIPLPHAQYMASLARLFDAVQVLDSIARQVEDPGLKFSSKTHVGLELSVRNAAEFFAFYIIRFVMADLTLLVDKFLKRGTEWVLA